MTSKDLPDMEDAEKARAADNKTPLKKVKTLTATKTTARKAKISKAKAERLLGGKAVHVNRETYAALDVLSKLKKWPIHKVLKVVVEQYLGRM